jgi:hypothetical protein
MCRATKPARLHTGWSSAFATIAFNSYRFDLDPVCRTYFSLWVCRVVHVCVCLQKGTGGVVEKRPYCKCTQSNGFASFVGRSTCAFAAERRTSPEAASCANRVYCRHEARCRKSWAGACGTATSRFARPEDARTLSTLSVQYFDEGSCACRCASSSELRDGEFVPGVSGTHRRRAGQSGPVCAGGGATAPCVPPVSGPTSTTSLRSGGSWIVIQRNGFAHEMSLHPSLVVPMCCRWFRVFVPGETDNSSWQSIRPVDSSAAPACRRGPSLAASKY